jgi:hypothetical protein
MEIQARFTQKIMAALSLIEIDVRLADDNTPSGAQELISSPGGNPRWRTCL